MCFFDQPTMIISNNGETKMWEYWEMEWVYLFFQYWEGEEGGEGVGWEWGDLELCQQQGLI